MTEDEAKALKVGDKVRCVNDDYAREFIVDEEYEIAGHDDEDGDPYIRLLSGKIWFIYDSNFPKGCYYKDFEVVKPAVSVPWKVGKTYKLRNDEERTVIWIGKYRIIVVDVGDDYIDSFDLDGRFYAPDGESEFDLMPPDQYLVVLDSVCFDSEEEAKTAYPGSRIIKI